MTDSHLDATIRLFERRAKEGITVRTGGSCAEDMFYDEDILYREDALEALEYDEYVKERDRRISIKKGTNKHVRTYTRESQGGI